MSLDISKLNPFSQEVYHKIIALHPEWGKYSKNDDESEEFLVISIPTSISDSFNLNIFTLGGEEEEITVHFGPPHIHLFMYKPFKIKTLDDQIEALEKIIHKIFNEEMIVAKYKAKFLFIPFTSYSFINPHKHKILLDKKRLLRSISWEGTFNYPKDGAHLEWNS